MKSCATLLLLMMAVSMMIAPLLLVVDAWTILPTTTSRQGRPTFAFSDSSRSSNAVTDASSAPSSLATTVTTVQVCHGKDCKRIGGGPKLLKAVEQIVQDTAESAAAAATPQSLFQVEACPCQGECGYGPNLVVNDKIVNSVRGRAAILQALGLPPDVNDNQDS